MRASWSREVREFKQPWVTWMWNSSQLHIQQGDESNKFKNWEPYWKNSQGLHQYRWWSSTVVRLLLPSIGSSRGWKRGRCERCDNVTQQKPVYIQRAGPHRWEEMFILCSECVRKNRPYPFSPVMKDLYCIKNIGGEEGSLEGAVITLLQDNDNCMHSDKIVNGLLRIHKTVKVSEYELQQSLRKMVSQGLLTMRTVDQTKSLIDELQQTKFSLCVNCGKDKDISLYSRFWRNDEEYRRFLLSVQTCDDSVENIWRAYRTYRCGYLININSLFLIFSINLE